jgi:hypothetical protein
MASKNLTIPFKCNLTQLANAAQKTLGLRNLVDADSIVRNLLHAIPNPGAIQDIQCYSEKGDDLFKVTLKNCTSDQNDEPTSEPSDPAEFQKAAKALQDLIFSEPAETAGST